MATDRKSIALSKTGSATAPRGLANSGIIIGDVNLVTGAPVRTYYKQQIRRIAPSQLLGRDTELAELAEFCLDAATAGTYRWWRADAWSGKSALLSWFALHPPTNVRLVSFFITARLAAQDDRRAFIDNVMEQLLAFLGQDLPRLLTDATREAHLLGLIAEAAEVCQERGESFVLLVDGLDEDRGVRIEAGSHSIAALLPHDPPAGMRVIIASRPNPPIPADVPRDHPLREQRVVRGLAPSPHARAIREEMELELSRLLRGSVAEQDLLGLVAAAGGGLSTSDLVELTGWDRWEVDRHLRAVTGRSFSVRGSHFSPGGPDVFLLGHEDLQVAAMEMLGPARVGGYQQRIRTWADQYRSRDWPADTPEYLLRGYFRMLGAAGEVAEMLECATDARRQDRMLDLSGGDAAALTEITAAIDAVAAAADLDVVAVLRLAIHRDHITDRNGNVPQGLPMAWANLGQVNRAETIAESIADPHWRAIALTRVAGVVGRTGDRARGREIFEGAERAARMVDDPAGLTTIRALMSEVAAEALDDPDLAEALARSIPRVPEQVAAVVNLVRLAGHDAARVDALIEFGLGRASSAPDSFDKATLLPSLANCQAWAGHRERAKHLLDSAEQAARSIDSFENQVTAFARIAKVCAILGDADRAGRLAMLARGMADQLASTRETDFGTSHYDHLLRAAEVREGLPSVLVELTRSSIALNEFERAEQVVNLVAGVKRLLDPSVEAAAAAVVSGGQAAARRLVEHVRSHLLQLSEPARAASLAITAATALLILDEVDRARELFAFAEDQAGSITDVRRKAGVLTEVAVAAATAGAPEKAAGLLASAEQTARTVSLPHQQIDALIGIARAAASGGDPARAELLVEHVTEPQSRDTVLLHIARMFVSAGDLGRAERLVDRITDPQRRDSVLLDIAEAAVAADDIGHAERLLRDMANPDRRGEAIEAMARAAAQAGQFARTHEVAHRIPDPGRRAAAFAEAATAAAAMGEVSELLRLVDAAELAADSMTNPYQKSSVLVEIALALRSAGYPERSSTCLERAEQAARSVASLHGRAAALDAVARAAVRNGDVAGAERIANEKEEPRELAAALADIVTTAARTGFVDDAERIARSIEDAPRRTAALVEAAGAVWHLHQDSSRTRTLLALAEEGAGEISAPPWRASAWVSIADVAAQIGDVGPALRLVDSVADTARDITGSGRQADLVAAAVRTAAAAGDLDRAERLARSVTDAYWRDTVLPLAMKAAANRGDFERAERLAEAITGDNRRLSGYAEIARAAAEAGDIEVVERCTLAIVDPVRQARALLEAARATGSSGGSDRAERLAGLLSKADDRRTALISATRTSALARRERIAIEVLRSSSWRTCLAKLVELLPERRGPMLDELIEIVRLGDTWRNPETSA